MKSFIFAAALALVGCTSHNQAAVPATAIATVHQEAPHPIPAQVIATDLYDLTVPGDFVRIGGSDAIFLEMGDAHQKLALMIQPFEGPIGEYAFIVFRAVQAKGYKVRKIQKTTWAKQPAVYMELNTPNDITVFYWALLFEDKAFNLSCGGPDQDSSLQVCQGIVDSFHLHSSNR
jgi:hypothetical protein